MLHVVATEYKNTKFTAVVVYKLSCSRRLRRLTYTIRLATYTSYPTTKFSTARLAAASSQRANYVLNEVGEVLLYGER
jgi:hypothetical protein